MLVPCLGNLRDMNQNQSIVYGALFIYLFIYLFAMFIQAIQFSDAGLNGGLFTY